MNLGYTHLRISLMISRMTTSLHHYTPAPGTRVLLRLDLNMPMRDTVPGIECADHLYAFHDNTSHAFTDLSRLHAIKETLIYLLNANTHVIILTHLGRPKAKAYDPRLTTQHLLPGIRDMLGSKVPLFFAPTLESLKDPSHTQSGSVVLLENMRFWEEETHPTQAFAHQLSQLGDAYINDAFSVSHRRHTSVYQLPHAMKEQGKPCFFGFRMADEVRHLSSILHAHTTNTAYPYTLACVGGSKVSTKINVINHLTRVCDFVFLGGGMANTFLIARGDMPKGRSFYEPDFIDAAQSMLKKYPNKIILPTDGVSTDHITHPTHIRTVDFSKNPHDETLSIVDIGPKTLEQIQTYIQKAHTIVWNGPFGVIEHPPFDQGSSTLARYIAKAKSHAHTVLGGGDTALCLKHVSREDFSYVSTAGGAFLEYLENGTLPGVEALQA